MQIASLPAAPTTVLQNLFSVKMAAALVAWLIVTSVGSLAFANAQTTQSFSDKQMECFNQRKVLYEGKCYDVLVTQPCKQSGHWLVITIENNQVFPDCKPCPCCNQGAQSVFLKENGTCVDRITDGPKVCKEPNTVLKNDVFGEGECACKDETFRHNSSSKCWPMYTQGPCREGEVLQPPVTSAGATCKTDRCRAYNYRNTGNRYALYNGRCYRLRDKCPGTNITDAVLGVDKISGAVQCWSGTLFIVSPPSNCVENQKGGCETQVNVPTQDSGMFLNSILAQAERRKKRNSGNKNWSNTL